MDASGTERASDDCAPLAEAPILSSEHFKYWIFNRSEMTVVMQDGRQLSESSRSALRPESEVASTIFDWDNWWVWVITRGNHAIVSEAFSPASPPPLRGRKSVYLDQNHWSTIARSVTGRGRVREPERLAALRLRELAADGGIVCPISSATLSETARLDRDLRYQIGYAIASMAGGWQLRHPLQIRV